MSSVLANRLADTEELYRRASGAGGNGVYLYGAGFVGRWSVDYLEGKGIPVLGFVDSDAAKWGTSICGKPVFSPTDSVVTDASVVLISSRHAVPAIRNLLSHLSSTIMSVDAFVVHSEGKGKIDEIGSLFSHDKKSLETYEAVLISMLEGNCQALAEYADSDPFFDRFGFFNRDGEIFVDAGAYVGDSVERFIWSVNGVFRHIHAFEPGRIQYDAMQNRVSRLISEWTLNPRSISLANIGLSAKSGVATMSNSNHPIQTRLGSPGDASEQTVAVRTMALDDYFNGEEFTLLKVDVEGSEALLLEGAGASIAKHRPRIALSVYHFPTDLFVLPLQCREANMEYRFSLGHHSSQLMDTVLY